MKWVNIDKPVLMHTAAARSGSHYIRDLILLNNPEIKNLRNPPIWEAFKAFKDDSWLEEILQILKYSGPHVYKVSCQNDLNIRQKIYEFDIITLFLFRQNLSQTVYSWLYAVRSKEYHDYQATPYKPRNMTDREIQMYSDSVFHNWLNVLQCYHEHLSHGNNPSYLIYEDVVDDPLKYFDKDLPPRVRPTDFNNEHADKQKQKIKRLFPKEYVEILNRFAQTIGLQVNFYS